MGKRTGRESRLHTAIQYQYFNVWVSPFDLFGHHVVCVVASFFHVCVSTLSVNPFCLASAVPVDVPCHRQIQRWLNKVPTIFYVFPEICKCFNIWSFVMECWYISNKISMKGVVHRRLIIHANISEVVLLFIPALVAVRITKSSSPNR